MHTLVDVFDIHDCLYLCYLVPGLDKTLNATTGSEIFGSQRFGDQVSLFLQ